MRLVFGLAACTSIAAVALICLFLLGSAIPAIHEIGPAAFLLGQKWKPGNDMYGILPMILGSVYVTAGALIVGGAGGAAHQHFPGPVLPAQAVQGIKALRQPAGRHSLGGIRLLRHGGDGALRVPYLWRGRQQHAHRLPAAGNDDFAHHHRGWRNRPCGRVPESYYEGSLALGATHERSVFFTIVPAARSGIMAGGNPGGWAGLSGRPWR